MKVPKKTKKILLLGVVALIAYWLYRRAYTVSPTNITGRTRLPVTQNLKNYGDLGRNYVTLLFYPNMDWDAYFTEIANIGYDGVIMSIPFADVVKPSGYNFTNVDRLFEIITAKGLQIIPNLLFKMGVGEWVDLGFQPSDQWLNADGTLYGDGSVSARYDSPIWKTHFEPFVSAFAQRYEEYRVKGWIECLSFANSREHELNYDHNKEPFGGLTYKQKHEKLKACFEGLTAAAGNFKTCYHSGEFQTSISAKAASLGFRDIGQKASWFKQNPNNTMDLDYVVRNTVSDSKGSIIELTFTEGDNEFTLSTKAGRAFELGAHIVTVAFAEGQEGLPKLRAYKQEMSKKGFWSVNRGALPSNVHTVYVSDLVANGGYNLAPFKAAYVGGVPPKINTVYNL